MVCCTPCEEGCMGEDTLSVKEVAALLGLNASTVRRKRERGELVAHEVHTKHGPAWRFPRHLLPAPVSEGETPTGAPTGAVVAGERGAPMGAQGVPGDLLLARMLEVAEDNGRLMAENARLRAMLESRASQRVPWWRRLFGRGEA